MLEPYTFLARDRTIVRIVDMSATSTTTKLTKLRQRATNNQPDIAVTDEGRKADKLLDSHTRCVTQSFLTPSSSHVTQLGVWWSLGSDCHDDRLPNAHVLLMDMYLVLRWPAHFPDLR